MADSSTPFGTIATAQGNQEAKANGLFNAVSPPALFALNYATTSGTTLGYHGGKLAAGGSLLTIADGTLVLTVSATNYVEAHPDTGAVSKNTTSYTPGYIRIGRAICGASSITTWYEAPHVPNARTGRSLPVS